MKRKLAFLLSILLVLGLTAGCAADAPADPTDAAPSTAVTDAAEETAEPSGPKEEGEIVMAWYPDRSINPFASEDYTNRAFLPLLYQGLFAIDGAYQLHPVLCKRFTVSEDMKNHVFTLDENARFSDGSPVTADDVAASLERARQEGYYAGRFTHIDEIVAAGDGTVLIQTDCAYEDLPRLLDIPIVKARQVDDPSPIGSGPFVMQTRSGQRQLERAEAWWCGLEVFPTLNRVRLVEGSNPSDIRDQFEFADVDLVCADPGSDSFANYRCDYELWDCENGIFVYLGCNMESSVFSNREVRQALTTAINRELLVDHYYRGFAWAAELPASPRSPYYNIGLAAQYAFDSDVFSQVLVKTKLKGSSITLLTNKDDSLRTRAARSIVQMLEVCGLEVKLEEKNTEDYFHALQMRDYDLYLGQTRLSPNMDLTDFFYEDGKLSFGPMDDPTLYSLCLQALENSGNYYDLHESIMNDGRLCPVLFRGYAVYATRGTMSDLTPARDQIFFYSIGRTMEEAAQEPELPEETTEPTGEPGATEETVSEPTAEPEE